MNDELDIKKKTKFNIVCSKQKLLIHKLVYKIPGIARPSSKYLRTDSLKKFVCIPNGICSASDSIASKCCLTSPFIRLLDARVTFPRLERTLFDSFDSTNGLFFFFEGKQRKMLFET